MSVISTSLVDTFRLLKMYIHPAISNITSFAKIRKKTSPKRPKLIFFQHCAKNNLNLHSNHACHGWSCMPESEYFWDSVDNLVILIIPCYCFCISSLKFNTFGGNFFNMNSFVLFLII